MNEADSTRDAAASIKRDIDQLRKQWEQLRAAGAETQQQMQIADQIARARERLRELTGEEY